MVKKALKFGLLFLLFGLVIVFTASTILAFAAPAFMAKTFENLNMPTLAYGCYDRQYRNSGKVDQQYIMFTKAVDISFNSHIVYYGEKLFNNENYGILILNINEKNIEKTEQYISENPSLSENEKIRLQILCRNEDNYIKNCYIKALINLRKEEKAKDFLVKEINALLDKNTFGKEASFAVSGYFEKVKILPEDLLSLTTRLYDAFELSLEYEAENITLENRVCFQRLTEIASLLSSHYKNAGDNEKSSAWFAKAQSYLNLIYA